MIKSKIKKHGKENANYHKWIKQVGNRFPQKVADYRAGKNKEEILSELANWVYILSKGKADMKAIELFLLTELNHIGIRNYDSTKIKVANWNRKEIMI